MSWKPIDFQGIVSLNRSIIEPLFHYLDLRENQTARRIIESLDPLETAPDLEPSSLQHFTLLDGIEKLHKKILRHTQSRTLAHEAWKSSAEEINRALWGYLEVLEESVTELFQQLNQVSIDEWGEELYGVVEEIKEILTHRLEDLKWALRRAEYCLRDFRLATEEQEGKWTVFSKVKTFWQSILDKDILKNAQRCQKYLGFRFQKFADRFARFRTIYKKVDQSLQKFSWYTVFGTLEPGSQALFKKIYQLTKLWEINGKEKAFPQVDLVRVLRNLVSPEKGLELFREYFKGLHLALFTKSRALKITSGPFTQENALRLQDDVLSYRSELHTLGSTVTRFREFLLRSDPNPYVRIRMGFPEWVAGPEPKPAQQLRSLGLDIEKLDGVFETFRQEMERKAVVPDATTSQVDEEVQQLLHEMGQPLISSALIRVKAERLVAGLEQLDELTNSKPEVVAYIGQTLNKALRTDWKYHVLFDIPEFRHLYHIHHGIVGPSTERVHQNRAYKFQEILHAIRKWVKNDETPRHMHEIEADMSDMKGYLQDFLATVQRLVQEDQGAEEINKMALYEISNQLLEYRYQFGDFFHYLHDHKPEERLIRNQFLFVDQYLEAVDNKLYEWKQTKQQKP